MGAKTLAEKIKRNFLRLSITLWAFVVAYFNASKSMGLPFDDTPN